MKLSEIKAARYNSLMGTISIAQKTKQINRVNEPKGNVIHLYVPRDNINMIECPLEKQ